MILNLKHRLSFSLQNVQATYLQNCGINRWLMFYTSGIVGTGSIGAAAFLAAATGRSSPALAAMAIKYSMQVSWALIWVSLVTKVDEALAWLQWCICCLLPLPIMPLTSVDAVSTFPLQMVRSFTDTETMAVSVERVCEYADLEPEEPQQQGRRQPEFRVEPTWPALGRVVRHSLYDAIVAQMSVGPNAIIVCMAAAGVTRRQPAV